MFSFIDLRMELFRRVDPLAVQVHTCRRTPIVAAYNTVRIHTWYHSDDEVSQHRSVFDFRSKAIKEAFED